MYQTSPGGVVTYYAVDPRNKGRVVHEGVRRHCLGWKEDSIDLMYEPLKTYPDQDLITDGGDATIVFIEVHVPGDVSVENKGFALLLHAHIDPTWIKGVFEYTKIQHEIAGA